MWGVFYENDLQAAFNDMDDAKKHIMYVFQYYPEDVKGFEKDRWSIQKIKITYTKE